MTELSSTGAGAGGLRRGVGALSGEPGRWLVWIEEGPERRLERTALTASTTDVYVANVLQQDLLAALAGEGFPLLHLPW